MVHWFHNFHRVECLTIDAAVLHGSYTVGNIDPTTVAHNLLGHGCNCTDDVICACVWYRAVLDLFQYKSIITLGVCYQITSHVAYLLVHLDFEISALLGTWQLGRGYLQDICDFARSIFLQSALISDVSWHSWILLGESTLGSQQNALLCT